MKTTEFFSKMKSRYLWSNLLAMAAAVVALVIGTAIATDIYTNHGEEITVPDLRNHTFSNSSQLLRSIGLQIIVNDTGYNRQLAPDAILQQMPAPGAKVKPGRTIYVTVNATSKPTLTMPDIIDNSSVREATAKLRIMGFKVGENEMVAGEKGWVYGAMCRGRKLAAGDQVPIDAMVTLLVGSGAMNIDEQIEYTDPEYSEPEEIIEQGDFDDFEEVTL